MRKLQILAALGLLLPLQAFGSTIYSFDPTGPNFVGIGTPGGTHYNGAGECSGGDMCADSISWVLGGVTVTADAYTRSPTSPAFGNNIVLWHDVVPGVGGLGGATVSEVTAGTSSADNLTGFESIHLHFSSPTNVDSLFFNGDHTTFTGYIFVSGGGMTLIDDVLNNGVLNIGAILVTDIFIEPDWSKCAEAEGVAFIDTTCSTHPPWYLAGILIPEPATLALLGLGLAGLGFSRRRKVKA